MAVVDDPASVLEQFMHDSANLPAEIAHLMEEMQAKESQIQECRNIISHRDGNIQKFIKLNGSLVVNPKEEASSKTVLQNYDRAQILQEEKIGLSERAAALLDRHIKRFDVKIRDLQSDGSMQIDPSMPSLLRESSGNLVPAPSSANTGANTPLHPLSGNASGGAPNIANVAMARMASAAASGRINSPSVAGMQPHPLLSAAHLAAAGGGSRQREMSVGSDTKRRRLNASLGAMPVTSSGLRQSSLGPSTPKAGTPGSRAGSVGPRPVKAITKKGLSQQHMRKKVGKGGIPKKSARRIMGHSRASPSTTGDDESVLSEGTGDDDMSAVHDGAADDDGMDVDEDEGDDTKYCTCRQVSFGDMVACDNANCPYQWFHWGCVGLTKEPVGEWLCPDCSRLPRNKIKKAS